MKARAGCRAGASIGNRVQRPCPGASTAVL